jgi:hypothetical protein
VYIGGGGGGEACLPTDPDDCGDGKGRSQARLVYPKGLAITPLNQLIFVDGSTVRIVEGNTIRTLAGERENFSAVEFLFNIVTYYFFLKYFVYQLFHIDTFWPQILFGSCFSTAGL